MFVLIFLYVVLEFRNNLYNIVVTDEDKEWDTLYNIFISINMYIYANIMKQLQLGKRRDVRILNR